MDYLFSNESIISLLTLTLLEIILGIDNVIFVSIIMGRIPGEYRKKARLYWMIFGIVTRVLLLMMLGWLLKQKGVILFSVFGHGIDLASLVMIGGGLFLLFKTVMEIHHKLEGDEEALEADVKKKAGGFAKAMTQIVLVDMVFSFDSVVTASGIAQHLEIMIAAVVIAMIIMFFFSDGIATFIHKHPTLKMLALSFLVMVGLVLVIEGWSPEKAHEMQLKNYVYFAMAFSFGVELINMKMRKKSKPVELREPDPEDVPEDIA
ncbi:MAG: TerC family protein [Phycisphaerales bacterium]|nr:TerC family protein [Phycisphaerales bacterium]